MNIITVCVHEVCAPVQMYTYHSACVSMIGHSGELYLSSHCEFMKWNSGCQVYMASAYTSQETLIRFYLNIFS